MHAHIVVSDDITLRIPSGRVYESNNEKTVNLPSLPIYHEEPHPVPSGWEHLERDVIAKRLCFEMILRCA